MALFTGTQQQYYAGNKRSFTHDGVQIIYTIANDPSAFPAGTSNTDINVYFDGVHYPDRMMKSFVQRYDTFTSRSFIDIESQDADDIIHLASFGDKLLQFKRNILHIVNCQQNNEVLEKSYKYT